MNLNEDASRVVQYLMDPDILTNRIELFEQTTDILIDAFTDCIDISAHNALELISEYRQLIKDFRTISNSLKENDHGQEQ